MAPSSTRFDSCTKVWSGPKETRFFDADCSIGKILFAFMRNNQANICQISEGDGTVLSHGEVVTFAVRIAQHLKALGLKQDDVVGVFGSNSTYLLPVVLGCFLNCTPFHAINPRSDEASAKYLFSVTRPKLIFCDGLLYPRTSVIAKVLQAKVFTLKQHRKDLPKVEDLLTPTQTERYYIPETLALGGDQTVAVLCTSGATGLPKSVCLSNSACLFDFGFVTSQDILLSFSTLDCSAGLLNTLFSCAHGATRLITDAPYTPAQLLELIAKFKVTLVALTSKQVTALLKSSLLTAEKLATVRFLSVSGGFCHADSLLKLQSYLQSGARCISYGYALSEFGGVAVNPGITRPGSVGSLVAGVKLKILDEAGRSLGPNETGEILVQHGKAWNGYYGDPIESKRLCDYQGWFHTGDLGYMDQENFLHVLGREKDVLRFHGMQYWPHEIEQVVVELADVVEVCVFGLWNEVDGDAAAAAVVKLKDSKLSEQEVVEHVAKMLIMEHKQLHCGVFFVDELPKTTSGVVLRSRTRDLALGKKWTVLRNGRL